MTEADTNDDSNGMKNQAAAASGLKMSIISEKYDRQQKGYLDSTEMKLRELDTENQGHLDIEKVYTLMKTLQDEQKSSMTLKKIIYALCGFALLLSLSNIGTSFAAAKLAKDASVNTHTHDFIDEETGERLGTTSKISVFGAGSTTSSRRNLAQQQQYFSDDGTSISALGAIALYQKVCSGFDYEKLLEGDRASAAACDAMTNGVSLSHCSDAAGDGQSLTKYTTLKMASRPARTKTKSDGKTKIAFFYYTAFRGDWHYDDITVRCKVGKSKCSVYGNKKGLTCETDCASWSYIGRSYLIQWEYWFCPAKMECMNDVPGNCTEALEE